MKNIRVSIFSDSCEQVFLLFREFRDLCLLLAAGNCAVLNYLCQTRDGRGAICRVQAILYGGKLVPQSAKVAARLPGLLGSQQGAARLNARVCAVLLQRLVFPTVAARHGGGAAAGGLAELLPPAFPEALTAANGCRRRTVLRDVTGWQTDT